MLAFDLDQQRFQWVMHVSRKEFQFVPRLLEPDDREGPLILDKLHLTSVHGNANGLYITGTDSGGMLHFSGRKLSMSAELPPGTHNARPFRAGVLFNDTSAGVVRYAGRDDMSEDRALAPGGQGLCAMTNRLIAVGSSPSTVTLYDLADNRQLASVALSTDEKHSIHSLAVWPLD